MTEIDLIAPPETHTGTIHAFIFITAFYTSDNKNNQILDVIISSSQIRIFAEDAYLR